jgi:hypothetical protein
MKIGMMKLKIYLHLSRNKSLFCQIDREQKSTFFIDFPLEMFCLFLDRFFFIYSKLSFHLNNVMSDVPTEPIPPVRPTHQRPPRLPPPLADGDTMERLFQALFYRIAVLYARAIPKHIRRLVETAILVLV